MYKKYLSISCLLAISISSSIQAAESVYVFYPTEVKAQSIQKDLVTQCPSLDFTVFGRSKDFRKELEKSPPSGIVTMEPIVTRVENVTAIASGVKGGRTEEQYQLVSVESKLDTNNLDGLKIGVIDLLGRKPMTEYVEQLLGTNIKLKRVTKVEDLLPLLSFGSVDGIFISSTIFESIKSKSNLDLVAAPLNLNVGLIQVAIHSESEGSGISDCVKKLKGELNSILGVEEWRFL